MVVVFLEKLTKGKQKLRMDGQEPQKPEDNRAKHKLRKLQTRSWRTLKVLTAKEIIGKHEVGKL
jgi:hypothetical protein